MYTTQTNIKIIRMRLITLYELACLMPLFFMSMAQQHKPKQIFGQADMFSSTGRSSHLRAGNTTESGRAKPVGSSKWPRKLIKIQGQVWHETSTYATCYSSLSLRGTNVQCCRLLQGTYPAAYLLGSRMQQFARLDVLTIDLRAPSSLVMEVSDLKPFLRCFHPSNTRLFSVRNLVHLLEVRDPAL